MKIKKFLAVFVAAVMCLSLSAVAFAVNGEEESTQESVSVESSTAEESTSELAGEEASSEEASSEEATSEEKTSEEVSEEASEESSEDVSEEESSSAPDKDDVIQAIISALGKIDIKELKDAFNSINKALGLPEVESFADIPAYADALYAKFEEMGLGYGDIINGITSSDLLGWLNDLIFGGSSKPVTTTAPAESESDGEQEDSDSIIPDTGASIVTAAVAVAAMGGSGALALFLRKRDEE